MVKPREEFLGSITQLDINGSGTINANNAKIQNVDSIVNTSKALAPITGPLKGAFWVDNSSPTVPKFTDSAGTTFTINGNGAASGDLLGNYPNPSVIGGHFGPSISAESILFDTIIEDGYFLKRYGNSIIGIDPEIIISNITAGGDLSSTYPDPEVIAAHFNGEQLSFNETINDGYILIRDGYNIIGKDPFSLTFGTSAGGDLSSTYPDPEVIAAHFNGEQLSFNTTINDGYLLLRNGSNIIGLNPDDIAFAGSAGGDLSSTYPDPEVIAAHFNGEQLSFDETINDGYILLRDGYSIIGLNPDDIAFAGSAGGDLSSTYPDPEVIAAHFNGEQLSFDETINDGYILLRDGYSIIGRDYLELISNINAGGDLSSTYPNPEVIAAHFNGDQLSFGAVTNLNLLVRNGTFINGLDSNNISISGNVTGDLGNTIIDSLTFGSESLNLETVPDGYIIIRDGYDIIGKNPIDLLDGVMLDGYVPINDLLTVTSYGQTIFVLSDNPLRNEIQLFINGQKQDPSDYSINGNQLTWVGDLIIEETDIIDISYFKLVINSGGYIISGQGLGGTLNVGNTTNGNNIELSNGDYLTSSIDLVTINTDGYINGNLTTNSVILKESLSNPNTNIQSNTSNLWISNFDKTVRIDGYFILPKKQEFYFDTLATESDICAIFDGYNMIDNSATWIRVNVICYRPLNTEDGITYTDHNLLIRKGYSNTYELIDDHEIFKQGTTESFSINVGFNINDIIVTISNDELADTLHFSGYCELGIIK